MTDIAGSPRLGLVCLQGGNELTPRCREMDGHLLALAPHGPVVVLPLASSRGSDYSRTAENAARYLTDLGADVVVPDDPRGDAASALTLVGEAGMIVLTGGSPRRLRDGLVDTGLDVAIHAGSRRGALVMGASAGAMVACTTTLLPQWRGNPESGPGIGLVDGYVVVPHFDGKRSGWVREALAHAPKGVLGIPECSGVIVSGGELTAVGVAPSTVITTSGRTELSL
jgi:cyanophycinase-like exopeptidase